MITGLSGFFPLHPMTEIRAIRNKKKAEWVRKKHGPKDTVDESDIVEESAV